jgi:predicted small integral membrane protein
MQSAQLAGGPFYFKRSGPFVVAVNGGISADEAQSLLASVNYDADVTWNQPTKLKPDEDRAGFIVALVLLCVIAVLGALIFGFAFGGIRILLVRLFPNKVFNRSKSADFIRLDLK